MAKTPCRGVRKDGTPCRGNGLKQLDGYCIAHASPEKTRAWRVRGGQNSSTAARADKRIPERLRDAINEVRAGMTAVKEGTMSPAAYNAICRGANTLVKLYQAADTEMDEVRAEESAAAAAEVYGLQGDLDVLKTADKLAGQHERYRLDSLIDQGLVSIEGPSANQTDDSLLEIGPALTFEGRRRFGYPVQNSYNPLLLEVVEEKLTSEHHNEKSLDNLVTVLAGAGITLEEAKDDLERLAFPPDPLTGQPYRRVPPGIKTGPWPYDDADGDPVAAIDKQLDRITDIVAKVGEVWEEVCGPLPELPLPPPEPETQVQPG